METELISTCYQQYECICTACSCEHHCGHSCQECESCPDCTCVHCENAEVGH